GGWYRRVAAAAESAPAASPSPAHRARSSLPDLSVTAEARAVRVLDFSPSHDERVNELLRMRLAAALCEAQQAPYTVPPNTPLKPIVTVLLVAAPRCGAAAKPRQRLSGTLAGPRRCRHSRWSTPWKTGSSK